MSFNNLLLALALTVLWPLVLMGVLAAAEWLERRTLTARELAPRSLRPAASTPEPLRAAMAAVAEGAEDDAGASASWAVAGRGAPGGTHGGSPDGPRGGAPASPRGAGAFGGGADPADGDRVAARWPFGGGGRHLRRAGGGRHERRG
jgi:hypothetical protein